jgi:hypothetical protein
MVLISNQQLKNIRRHQVSVLLPVLVLWFSITLLLPVLSHGQVSADRSDVNVRQADPDRIAAYKNDRDFTYDDSEPEMSFISMLINEVIQFLDESLGEGTGNTILRGVFFLVMMGVIYLIVNQIMKGNISSALSGRSASEEIRFMQDPALQKEEDLNRKIQSAADEGNYREAVRLIYQKTLKELSRAGLIQWATHKTNFDYLYEMDAHPSSVSFRHLTRIYEYTEYGDFGIDRDGLERVRELYSKLNNKLNGEPDA